MVQKHPKAVVLTGTTLGNWWFWTRLSAAPILNRFFYHTFKGNLFVRAGGGKHTSQRFANQPHFHDPSKMMTLPNTWYHLNLVSSLKQTCPVYLIWGKQEVFYPRFLVKSLSRQLGCTLHWNEGGHYCMWTHAEMFHRHMNTIEKDLTAGQL